MNKNLVFMLFAIFSTFYMAHANPMYRNCSHHGSNALVAKVNWGPDPANAGTEITGTYQSKNLTNSTTTTATFFIGFLRKGDNSFFDHHSFHIDSDQNSVTLENFTITTPFSETSYEILFGLMDNGDFVECVTFQRF
ncbi:hypothetical protein C2G38_1414912 [Gigaspora rosea]|uniref:Reelin domain-containing protein n=1 Tax=Gigaspora rosea TaxID=44941 RepID=A0A397VC84_9GLOM|nr:hypothetical protein C2G38_1414912 [Gigaspora rosea]